MNKRKKNSLLVLIYSVTLFVCFGIVTMVGRLSSPSPDKTQTSEPVTMEVTEGETKESETEPSLPDLESQTTQEETKESIAESKAEISSDQTTETEEVYKPPSIVIATDVHYYSPDLTDYGQAFWTM